MVFILLLYIPHLNNLLFSHVFYGFSFNIYVFMYHMVAFDAHIKLSNDVLYHVLVRSIYGNNSVVFSSLLCKPSANHYYQP